MAYFGWLNVACLPVVQEVVDLAVAAAISRSRGAAALPGRFGDTQALLALEEPLEVLAAAGVWSGCVVSVASGSVWGG